MSAVQIQIEPPDLAILKEENQLEFYIEALRRWAAITAATGLNKAIQAELVLTFAFNQHRELCKELSSHFGSELRDKEDGIERLITWLQTRFSLNHHANMVKIMITNNFLDTCRQKDEDLVNYIARFEKSLADVKKMGENFSPTCLSLLLLRQAQLSNTDSQIIRVNLESKNASQHFEETKAAITKFQHQQNLLANRSRKPKPGNVHDTVQKKPTKDEDGDDYGNEINTKEEPNTDDEMEDEMDNEEDANNDDEMEDD